ncbi:MAG TPA: hypothetical protein VFI95_02010 [Terriglobales bacterium]|nr:hypothetical protein [Terriglobales bacterium]
MNQAAQLVPVAEAPRVPSLHDIPRLLIDWSSPWEEFLTAIRPALARSPKPLAGEAPTRIFPYRGVLAAWTFEALLLTGLAVLSSKIASLQPYTPLTAPKYDVIYFSKDELPQTDDLGGAERGKSGRAGGQASHHHTQTIRVARGESPSEKVVDAPKINLPKSDLPVANLLAFHPIPGPPPTSGLRSSLHALPQAEPIAPPPDTSPVNARNLPAMATSIVAPPPDVALRQARNAPAISTGIVAPPPEVSREKLRAVQGVNTSIIAPPPSIQPDVAGTRVPSARVEVVPPPVSAPVNPTSMASRLTLPQASVIAPPPSSVRREVSSSYGAVVGQFDKQIVPPPVNVGGRASQRQFGSGIPSGGSVVPPPPSLGEAASAGSASRGTSIGGPALAAGVVPPPPSISGGSSIRGGRGAPGGSQVGTWDAKSLAPSSKGGGTDSAVVVTNQPGSRPALPGTGGSGAIAMSPAGAGKTGLGGSGNGGGIGHGTGPGSGISGEGTGTASAGTGRGSDIAAKGGISPYPGPSGAGTARAGNSATPGVSVNGGSTITLPSFGSPGNGPDIADPSRTHASSSGPGITIVASSRSGGAFNYYGLLKGDPVYTIYIGTTLGTAVLQYADPSSVGQVYAQDLRPPEPMRAELPAGLSHSRLVIACVLDQSGLLRNIHVLERGPVEMSSKVLQALPHWKFRPAFRGDQPVEVNAILGFNIDTR